MKGKSNHPVMDIFKTNLVYRFYISVTKGMTDAGCHYFAHNLIKNREEAVMNSFTQKPDWSMKYWEKYWNCNPEDYKSYMINKIIGYGCLGSPHKDDPEHDTKASKKEMCKMKDGFHLYMQHDNGILENFSFGWETFRVNQVSPQKIGKLRQMMTELKIGFFRLNRDMFDTYPVVY
jgi:hypothetical protein